MATAIVVVAWVALLVALVGGSWSPWRAVAGVGFVAAVSVVALWKVWRPVVFLDGDRLVVRNFFSRRRVVPREEVLVFRVAPRDSRTTCVWVLTRAGAVPLDAASRPRGFSGSRDLDADVALLDSWFDGGSRERPAPVSYLP